MCHVTSGVGRDQVSAPSAEGLGGADRDRGAAVLQRQDRGTGGRHLRVRQPRGVCPAAEGESGPTLSTSQRSLKQNTFIQMKENHNNVPCDHHGFGIG